LTPTRGQWEASLPASLTKVQRLPGAYFRQQARIPTINQDRFLK